MKLGSDFRRVASIDDLERLAKKRLPGAVYDFIAGGATDEMTLAANRADFGRLGLTPSVAVNVSGLSMETNILGRDAALPLFLSPTGGAGFYWPRGDHALAGAAAAADVPFTLSINSVATVEEVAQTTPEADRWLQVYFLRDRPQLDRLIDRAKVAGYRVLVVTADVPVVGKRERDIRSGYSVPLRFTLRNFVSMMGHPGWLAGTLRHPPAFGNYESRDGSDFAEVAKYVNGLIDPSATWDDIAAIRNRWDGPLLVKGVLTPSDAGRAFDAGADGVIVSNHGGRQLDGVSSTIAALPAIRSACPSGSRIFLDGGIRCGSDIVKALALGADAVGIGRAALWGLAAGGEAGVTHALALLGEELRSTLALLGCPSTGRVNPSILSCRADLATTR